jgi:DNA repair exonuclease SbcCD nuclease subunit
VALGHDLLELALPPEEANVNILCLHQSFTPPLEGDYPDHELSDVLDSTEVELDGVALGHIHKPESAEIDGTEVWYAGSTARTQKS